MKRGGALLGGQQTKRAWNLRFLSTVEPSDTHNMHADVLERVDMSTCVH